MIYRHTRNAPSPPLAAYSVLFRGPSCQQPRLQILCDAIRIITRRRDIQIRSRVKVGACYTASYFVRLGWYLSIVHPLRIDDLLE